MNAIQDLIEGRRLVCPVVEVAHGDLVLRAKAASEWPVRVERSAGGEATVWQWFVWDELERDLEATGEDLAGRWPVGEKVYRSRDDQLGSHRPRRGWDRISQ